MTAVRCRHSRRHPAIFPIPTLADRTANHRRVTHHVMRSKSMSDSELDLSGRYERHPNPYAEASQPYSAGREPSPLVKLGTTAAPNKRNGESDTEGQVSASKRDRETTSGKCTKRARKTAHGHGSCECRVPPRMMTDREVAAYMRLSVSTVRRLMKQPDFPQPRKIGESTRWDRRKVDAFLDSLQDAGV